MAEKIEKPQRIVKAASKEQVEQSVLEAESLREEKEFVDRFKHIELDHKNMLSTGSTLLDLAISGKRIRGGGIPGGCFVEIFGPSGLGKTAMLVETGMSAQLRGGRVDYLDPESRLDLAYSNYCGLDITEENYYRPDTVNQMFEFIKKAEDIDPNKINLICADSLAALSTDLEMSDSGDKMGMKRAKDFSAGFRTTARLLGKQNRILLCSNQIREDENGSVVSPGGKAIAFYASIRIRLMQPGGQIVNQIKKTKTVKITQPDGTQVESNTLEKVIGIKTVAQVVKSIDDPFRTAPICLYFGEGINDVQANIQYLKDVQKLTKFPALDKDYVRLEDAVNYIYESNERQVELRERVIDVWEEIERNFKVERRARLRR